MIDGKDEWENSPDCGCELMSVVGDGRDEDDRRDEETREMNEEDDFGIFCRKEL